MEYNFFSNVIGIDKENMQGVIGTEIIRYLCLQVSVREEDMRVCSRSLLLVSMGIVVILLAEAATKQSMSHLASASFVIPYSSFHFRNLSVFHKLIDQPYKESIAMPATLLVLLANHPVQETP